MNWDPTRTGEVRLNAYRALRPSQGCIRDVPVGAWVLAPGGAVYQVAAGGTIRHVVNATVRDSWGIAPDIIPICSERLNEFSVGAKWGYRPGRLIRNPSTGAIYLISTDGADRGLPNKRWISSGAVFSCFGWNSANVIDDTGNVLSLHPTGPNIASCNPLVARSFPNGTLVKHPSGAIYMIDAGLKRHIVNSQVFASWFASFSEAVAASDLEVSLISTGQDWAFRQGRLIQQAGSLAQYFVTDDALLRARGARRHLVDMTTLRERGFGAVPLTSGVSSATMSLHPVGSTLSNANNIP